MAFNYSPKIVTDGLVLYLDAANPKSYVSGSTAWNDLSRSGFNGTLTNGPTFNTGSGGSIVFDGVDDFIDCGSSDVLKFLGTSPYTVDVWFYQQVLQSGFPSIWSNDPIVPREGTSLFITSTSFSLQRWVNGIIVLNTSMSRTSPSLGTGTPINVVVTYNGQQSSIFANGIIGPTNSTTVPLTTASSFIIGKRGGLSGGNQFNGGVYICRVYNRSLSSSEVLQNYNATKTRFGL